MGCQSGQRGFILFIRTSLGLLATSLLFPFAYRTLPIKFGGIRFRRTIQNVGRKLLALLLSVRLQVLLKNETSVLLRFLEEILQSFLFRSAVTLSSKSTFVKVWIFGKSVVLHDGLLSYVCMRVLRALTNDLTCEVLPLLLLLLKSLSL